MERNCKNCKFMTYAEGGSERIPLCHNKAQKPGIPYVIELTETCRNFLCKVAYRENVTQPADPSIRLIVLTHGRVAIVDAQDYERVNKYIWSFAKRYSGTGKGYARGTVNGKRVKMHRYLMNFPRGLVIDHIDGNGLNNCKANLRLCTQAENARNVPARPGTTSKYKGVHKIKESNTWRAAISVNHKRKHLGVFDDEIEAAKAYDSVARKYHGEFAYLNFPCPARPESIEASKIERPEEGG